MRRMRSRTTGIRTTAVRTRFSRFKRGFALVISIATLSACSRRVSFHQSAISPLPLLILGNSFQQMDTAKLGPERGCDIDLRIGQLPKQKIAEPHFPGRADDEIGIRQVASVQVAADCVFVDVYM